MVPTLMIEPSDIQQIILNLWLHLQQLLTCISQKQWLLRRGGNLPFGSIACIYTLHDATLTLQLVSSLKYLSVRVGYAKHIRAVWLEPELMAAVWCITAGCASHRKGQPT